MGGLVGCGAYVLGGNIIPRIRLTSAKDLVEVEAELGKMCKTNNACLQNICSLIFVESLR